MSNSNDSIQKTVTVALLLCIVCSVIVSAAAIMLKPVQVKNRDLDMKMNILAAAGMLPENATSAKIEEVFKSFEVRLVNLDTGEYVDPQSVGASSALAFDQYKAAKAAPALSGAEDIAGIKRRGEVAKVYLLKDGDQLSRIVLPVHGYGLWSTLYGFMALEADANTVVGLGFYAHAETPGLGGEVDNPNWKALWSGKQVFTQDTLNPVIEVIKGNVDAAADDARYKVDGLAGATLTSRGVTNLVHFWLGKQGFATYLNKLRAGEV
ncbi:MAG: Na(+)-translocating NADH-quinone reductase subunit C [Gammaproteobacteria bacterium]|nr:Na(+)-translocating NADH-quinone reductase subunit C [Gammaproteobacteria bacterium]